MATRMQQRRGTALQWTTANPILNVGEIGYETDTNSFRIGDGTNHWDDLTPFYDGDAILANVGALLDLPNAPSSLNTLNELAAALGDNPAFLSDLATYEYVDNALSAQAVDLSTSTGVGLFWDPETEQFSLAGSVTSTEIAYVHNVTSPIQEQLDNKQGIVADVSNTEISYLNGVTSSIQDQLNAKAESADIAELSTDAVATALTTASHTNITVSYDDNAGTISLTAAPGYTDENAQDAIGNNVGTGLSYNDSTGAISVDAATIQSRVTDVSDTEIGYLNGVTSAIQTQLNDKLALGGGTMFGAINMGSKNITGLATPTDASDAATKGYVDGLAEGLDVKASVNTATTENIDLSSAPDNVDGVYLYAGNRILVKNQTDDSQNGIYTFNEVGEPLTRSIDANSPGTNPGTNDLTNGSFTFVEYGSQAGKGFVANVGGMGDITWTQFSEAGSLTASGGITITGSDIAITDSAVGTFATTPSSANLAAAVSDETGSGALVFGTSPTIVTPRVQLAMNAQTGTSYTIALSDASSKWVTCDNSSAITVTVPPSVFSVGDQITIQQTGAGQVTFAQGAGVTITAAAGTPSAPKIRTRYASAVVICTASNTFTVIGDLI